MEGVVVCKGNWKDEGKVKEEEWIPPAAMLLLLSFGVFLVYISFGYLQESILSEPGFTFMEFMTLWQNFSYFFCGLMDYLFFGNGWREVYDAAKKPQEGVHKLFLECRKYFLISLLVTLGTGLSNFSFRFLSFPVQQIFKSCKLLPVMIARMVFIENDYTVRQYVASVLLTFGLALFTVADHNVSATFNILGVVVIISALLLDGLAGMAQEIVLRPVKMESLDEKGNSVEVILQSENHLQRKLLIFVYGFGTFFMLVVLIATDEFGQAIAYHKAHPQIFWKLILLSANSYIGVRLVIELVQRFDSGVATAVTTMRKFTTILLSFFFFPKPMTMNHLVGGILVVIGFWMFNLRIFQSKS